MKTSLTLLTLFFSITAFAQTDFNAVLIKDLNVLSIRFADDGMIPPFEGGALWSVMKGTEQRKYVDETGFNLECDGFRNNTNDIYGTCTLNIPMDQFQKIGKVQVFKLKGGTAAKLNRYFIDSAYVSLQGGRVYLSSYNTRREFFFGIQDNLIKR